MHQGISLFFPFRAIFTLLFIVVACTYTPQSHMAFNPQRPGQGSSTSAGAQPSPENIDQLIKEIDNEFAQMSPEQQTSFMAQVERTQKNLEQLPEDEVMRFIEGIMGGNGAGMSQAEIEEFVLKVTGEDLASNAPKEEPAKEPEQKTNVEEPAISTSANNKAQTTVELVKNLIKNLESFIAKMQSIPDIELKVTRWQKKGALAKAAKPIEWSIFQFEIEKFIQRLHALIAQDSKTKLFIYLKNLNAETPVIILLKKFSNELDPTEKQISVPPFGIGKITPASKKAIQKIINLAIKLLNDSSAIADLDEIIASFDPEAKKLRDSLLSIEKKASEAAQRPRKNNSTISGGSGKTNEYAYNDGTLPYPGGQQKPYGTRVNRARETENHYIPDKSYKKNKPDEFRNSDNSSSQKDRSEALDGKKTSLTESKSSNQPAFPAEQKKFISEANRLTQEIYASMDEISHEIKNSTFFANPQKHLTDNSAIEESFQDLAGKIMKKLSGPRKSVKDNLNALGLVIKSIPAAEKNNIKAKIKSMWNKYEWTYKSFVLSMNLIKKNLSSLAKQISPIKQYFYLGTDASGKIKTPPPQQSLDLDIETSADNADLEIAESYLDIIHGLNKMINATDLTCSNCPKDTSGIEPKLFGELLLIAAKKEALVTPAVLTKSGKITRWILDDWLVAINKGIALIGTTQKNITEATDNSAWLTIRQFPADCDVIFNDLENIAHMIDAALKESPLPIVAQIKKIFAKSVQEIMLHNDKTLQLIQSALIKEVDSKKALSVSDMKTLQPSLLLTAKSLDELQSFVSELLSQAILNPENNAVRRGLQNEDYIVQQEVFNTLLETVNLWLIKIQNALLTNDADAAVFIRTVAPKAITTYVRNESEITYAQIFGKISAIELKMLSEQIKSMESLSNIVVNLLNAFDDIKDKPANKQETCPIEPTIGSGIPLISKTNAEDEESLGDQAPPVAPEQIYQNFPAPASAFNVAFAIKECIESVEKFVKPIPINQKNQ